MAYNPRDYFFKKAKEQNFAARSVFKLEEIDKRFRIFKSGMHVLDLGCAPGSWSQYASKKVGSSGFVLAIDLQKVELSLPNVRFTQADAFDEKILDNQQFDVVLSDMAPKTTGIRLHDQQRSFDLCLRALEVAKKSLKPKGHLVVKLFQSSEFDHLLKLLREVFEKVEIIRPKSTRKQSFEIYLIGLGKRYPIAF